MIKIEDIYRKTRDGLDVILHYYPQAQEAVQEALMGGTAEHVKKKFKVRPAEKTASACLLLKVYPDYKVWKVCDFGDEGRALSPLDICKKEEGISRTYEAVLRLAALFDVRDELNRAVNKPDVKKRPATEEEKDGTRIFNLLPTISENHLKVLGPKVKKEDVESLNWHEAEYVGFVKNREVVLKYGNENYPIFMRECFLDEKEKAAAPDGKDRFYKIYEPLNPDKGFRFSYTPSGVKPPKYINGLQELRKLYAKYNAQLEADFRNDPANDEKPYHEQKLKEAFLCSGERDALCCKSMGFAPVWLNSETAELSEADVREIMKYVEVLYNIPDIDETGRKKGTELALKYIDIHTVWLPDWLKGFKDNRGKPRKDLRDWMELRSTLQDFRGLMELAMPAKFWTERTNKKTGEKSYDIDAACFHYFLRLNGFYTLHDDNTDSARFIHVSGNIVTNIKPKDIRQFVRDWAVKRCLTRPIRNLILNSPKVSAPAALESLQELDLDFTNYTATTQLFFFPKKTIEATPTGLIEHPLGESKTSHYVWSENVLQHNVKLLPPMFEITRKKSGAGDGDIFDIEIKGDIKSHVWGYIINSSRVFWRKELEENFKDRDAWESEAYFKDHHFCIDGEGLSEDEIREQKQNLINKVFSIGYMLHRYKSPSRAWAPQAMDNKIGEDGECNGRSGKSFLFKALSYFMKTVKLSGRNPKLMENPHVFDQVTKHTDFVLVDDCDRYLSTDAFYDLITSDMTVNPKNNQSYTIPFEESPKFAFTTNFVPKDFDASTEARLLYMVYSDYYHQRTETNDYQETRSIRDDFGKDLFGRDYTEDDWNADINFFMQCCQFYLSLAGEGIKLLPPMGNILQRKYKADMGSNFEEWAGGYFSEESGHLDCMLVRRNVYEDFINDAKVNKNYYTMNRFTKSLRAFCILTPYIHEMNPASMLNNQGRIIRRINDKSEDMVFIETWRLYNQSTLDPETLKQLSAKPDNEVPPF